MKKIGLGSALAVSLSAAFSLALGAEKLIEVATIIDKPEAESLLGEPVKSPLPRNMKGRDGYYSKCTYYSAISKKSLVLRLHQPSGENPDAQKEFDNVTAGIEVKSVEGLGDKACILKGGPENGMPDSVVMLYVSKDNTLLTIGLGGIENESLAVEKVKWVARKLLAHL